MTINEILELLNEQAHRFRFGDLQDIRKKCHRLKKKPTLRPFRSTKKDWAHHVGGRRELQFNVGFDNGDLRWGVAISLQPSRSMPDPSEMYPKLSRLNRFLDNHVDYLEKHGFTIKWDWTSEQKHTPQPIPDYLYTSGTFVFLGKHAPINKNAFDEDFIDAILKDFDALLPVYEFVECDRESDNAAVPVLNKQRGFVFKPDDPLQHDARPTRTTATRNAGETGVSLRHRELQDALKRHLHDLGVETHSDAPDGKGRYIDLVARRDSKLEFYEIKTDSNARLCVRHAIGQLLEYSYWPEPNKPNKLVVVGEHQLDPDTAKYLETLRTETRLPISYLQVMA